MTILPQNPSLLLFALGGLASLMLACPGGVDEKLPTIPSRRAAAALSPNPERDRLLHKGAQLLADGLESEAVSVLEQAHALDPHSGAVVTALGRAYLTDEKFAKAEEMLESYLKGAALAPETQKARELLVEVLLHQGEVDAAKQACRPLLQRKPVTSAAMRLAGSVEYRQGNLEAALEHLRAAIELDSSDAEAHSVLGLVLLQQGKADEAAVELEEAIRLDPDAQKALHNLAKVYERLGRPEDAEQARAQYQKIFDRKSARQRLAPLRAKGVDDYNEGRYQEALESFRAILEVSPRDPQALAQAGSTLMLLDRLEPAEELLKGAVEVQPGNSFALTELGRLYALRNELPRAIETLERAAQANPSAPEPHYFLAGIYFAQGRQEDFQRERAAYERLRTPEDAGSLMPLPGGEER